MEKTLPSFIENTIKWKKEKSLSFKKIGFTCFVSAFVFLLGFAPGKSFGQDISCTWTSVNASNLCVGSSSNFTLTAKTADIDGADIPAGKQVLITFPDGLDPTSITSGSTFQGFDISLTILPNTVSFNVPSEISVSKGSEFVILLNGVTNKLPGDHQLSMKIDNSTGSQDIFDAGVNSQVTINPGKPTTPGDITGPVTACKNTTGNNYSINTVTDATSYTWDYTGSGATITGSGTDVTIAFAANATSGNLTVTANNSCGSSAPQTLAITVNAAPAIPGDITGSTTACKNTTGNNYSINAVTDATSYTWDYTGSGVTITGSGTSITVAFAANATSGNLSVTANNACGSSAPQTLAITVNAAPATPGDITGSTTACKNTTGNNYSINAVTDATSYTWDYTGSGATITGSGTSVTVAFAANATSGNLSVTANNACGSSAPQTLAITVNAAPATPGDITGSTTVCKNTTGNNYSINAVTGATSYTWDYTGSGVTITGSGTSITVAFAANATSGNLSVTANNSCGNSNAKTLAITVNDKPATPGTITGAAAVCAGTTANGYSITDVTGATSYTWLYSGTGATITGSGTSITVAFAANATSGDLSVTANNSCGNSNAKTLAITVNDKPATPGTITGAAAGCAGTTANGYSITDVTDATSYTWAYSGTGATITGSGTSVTVAFAANATNGNLSVTANNSCGNSNAKTLAITVNDKPATPGTITGAAAVCAGTTANGYSITDVTDATSYTWAYSGTGATITGSGTSVTVAFAANATSGNLSVTANNSCGNSNAKTLAITVNDKPATPGTITGAIAVCAGTTANDYSITDVTGATSYTWAYSGTGATITGSGTSITVAFAANATSGDLSVTANNSCGNSNAKTLAITINDKPATPGTITGAIAVCAGTTTNTYSITDVTGATSYTWAYSGAGATITGSGTSVTVAFAANATNGNLSVTANNSCGNSNAKTLAITVNDKPATPGTITGAAAVCAGTTANGYSITDVTGATSYTWSYSGTGATITGSGTSITVAFAANATSGDLSVTANNSCGRSNPQTQSVTINPNASIASVTGTTPLCIGATATYSANSVVLSGGTGAWSSSNTAIATVDASGVVTAVAAGTCNIIYTITGGCGGTKTAQQSVTINPNASIASVTGTTPLCIGATATYSANSVVLSGGTGAWSSSNTAIATIDASGVVTAVAAGTCNIIYTITGGCGGTKTAQQSVTINPNASIASVTGTTPLCIGATATYSANSVVLSGGTGAWSSSNTAIATVNASGVVTAVAAGTCNIIYTITGGCGGTKTAQQSVTINPNASIASVTGTTPLCIGATATYSANSVVLSGGTGAWSSSNTAIATVNASGVVTAVAAGTCNIIYTITGACGGTKTAQQSVTINPNASVASVTGTTPLCIGATATYSANSVVLSGGTGAWSSSNTAIATVNASGVVTAVAAGTCNIIYTITGACGGTKTAQQSVTVSPPSAGGNITPSQTIACSGSNSGTLTLNNSVGTVTWQKSIDQGANWSNTTNTYSNLTQTTLFRASVVSGTCGSVFSDTAVIVVNEPFIPTITASPASAVCSGTPVTLTASGFESLGVLSGGDFSGSNNPGWSGADASNSNGNENSFWGQTTGGKTVNGFKYSSGGTSGGGKFMIVTGNAGGTRPAILSTPIFSLVGMPSAALEYIQGYNLEANAVAKVEISTDGGTSYTTLAQYQGPSTLGPANNFNKKTSIDLKAYLGKTNLKVRFYYLGTYSSTSGSNWAVDDIFIVGPHQALNYSWGSAGSGSSITVIPTTVPTTTYSLSTSYGSCTGTTTTITINVNPLPTQYDVTGGGSYCAGGTGVSVGLSNSQTGVNYQLLNGTTAVGAAKPGNGAALNFGFQTAAGTYTVKATNATTACTQNMTGSATVTINQLPTVSPITGTTSVCVSKTTTLSNATSGGTWSSSNTAAATVNSATGVVTGVAAGSATITYTTAANANGCTNSATASVTVNALPTVAAITGTTSVCVNSTTTLSDATSGGTWSSSNPAVATVNSATGVVTGVAAGSTTITYTTAANANGCTNSATAPVTVNASPTVAAITGTTGVCVNSTTTLSDATASGTWSSSNTSVATVNSTTGLVTGLATGTATITYTVTNAQSCTNSTTAPVTVNPSPAPKITANGPTISCVGSVKLTSDSASGNQWYKDGVAIPLATQQSYTAALPGRYTVVVTNSSGCSGTSPATDISFITSSWTAAAGTTDWNTDANWCSGKVPTDSTNAIIPSNAVLFPQLSNASQVRSLEIQPGAKVSLNGNTLTVNGALTGTGEFVGSPTSGLIVNGTSTSTVNFLQSPDAVSNVLSDLIINTTGTVTLSNKLYITGTLTSTKGTLNTGDHLTIRSTSIANTARVASVSGTISGDVTVERFIPARRAYRFISPSVSTTTSIMDNWMEGGHNSSIDPPPYNPNHGYGTNITGPNPNTNGFDPTITSNPSLFTFNISTQQWDSVPNTKGSLSAGDAYSLMVRGDRSIDMRTNTPTPTNTILRASGKLFTGDYSPTLTNKASKYTFIGNPYASPVDFTKILANANNVGARYWAWDPRVSRRGQYVVYDALNNSNSLPGVSEVDKNIQSGQAFFVQTISGGSASLSFKESYKSTGNTAVFRDPRYTTKLSIQLLLNLNAGLENKADGVVSFFDKDYSSAIGSDDSYKFTNLDENLAINRNGTALSIEGRPTITADDTIPLKIWQFRQSNYYLRLAGSNFSPDVTAFIKDEYLHKQTPVDLSSVTLFPFSIDTSAASFAKDRFSIVFKAGSALPVTLTNVKAYQKNNGIEVDWTSEAETNIAQYEIEKSVNGQDFIKATSINAKGNNSVTENYGWLDEIPNLGSNFYRIKVVEKSGAIKYSNVVRVNIAEVNSSITVFPNPIKDNLVKVQFNNMEKGRYFAVLYNTLGQKLYSSTIDHTTTSGTYTISLGRLISKGTYTLHISKGGITRNERVIVE